MKTEEKKYFKHFKDSWWVFVFLFLCLIVYEKHTEVFASTKHVLKEQLSSLKEEKQKALEEQNNLKQQIQAQEDPKWIELVLMKRLGLAPRNAKKVVLMPQADKQTN